MAVVCDTGAIYALYDADDFHHQPIRRVVEAEVGPLYVPVVLLAEIDYLLHLRLGVEAALDFLESLETGAFTLEPLFPADIVQCRRLMHRYQDLQLGLADASVVATAERLQVQELLTVDQRHFRTVRPEALDHFIILPADRPH